MTDEYEYVPAGPIHVPSYISKNYGLFRPAVRERRPDGKMIWVNQFWGLPWDKGGWTEYLHTIDTFRKHAEENWKRVHVLARKS